MKSLFFVVCLLNILFFFWEFHAGGLTPPVELPSSLPSLLLVSERDTARRGAEISAYQDRQLAELQAQQVTDIFQRLTAPQGDAFIMKGQPAPKPTAAIEQQAERNNCYEAGPFVDQADARRWSNAEHIKAFEVVSKELAMSADFQVYYPAAKDAEQARINKMMLKAKGFTDVWTVMDGEVKGALSLGVFSDKQRAIVFKAQLAERGVAAEIRQRTKTRSALFIRFMQPQSAAARDISYVRLPLADCETR